MKAIERAEAYWSARSPRERMALSAAAAAVIAAALYLLLLGPGLEARARLAAALPKLRAQLDDMHRQEKEIALLRRKVGANPQRADLKPVLQSALARTSFVNAVTRIDPAPGGKAVFVANPVNFDEWVAWVEKLQREFGVRLEEGRIAAIDQPGLVRVEATFAAPGLPGAEAPR
jgi:general secretion pathway protein M